MIRLGDWADGLDDYLIAEAIIGHVGCCDDYHWVFKNVGTPLLNNRVHFSAYCCQDVSIQQQIPEQQLQRFHNRMDTFECGGTLKGVIDRRENVVELSIVHDRLHALPEVNESRTPTSQQAIDFIQHEAQQGTSATETYRRLHQRFPDEYVSPSRVGYW